MAGFNPFDLGDIATSQSYDYWLSLGINLILSTIIGGIILIVILVLFSKKFGESVSYGNAFLAVLIANIINFLGILGLLGSFVSISYLAYVIPLLVWIGLIKAFFGNMSIVHAVIVGVVFFAITILLIPSLTAMISSSLNLV